MAVVTIQAYACERCNYRWSPRDFPVTTNVDKQPKVCPKCKTPFWNRPRMLNIPAENRAAFRA